jgi:hypothetical protein
MHVNVPPGVALRPPSPLYYTLPEMWYANAMTPPIPIYTIGYGGRDLDAFIADLRRYDIGYVVDVRTAPYSRFKPEYSKDALAAALEAAGIRYLFMGDQLGGRPDDPACYVDGKVDYEQVKTRPFYQAGLARIQQAFTQQLRVALMCSEGKPEQCHRSKLIAASLTALDIPVAHIDENGGLKTQADVLETLTGGQLTLFGAETFTSRKRYRRPNADDDSTDFAPDDLGGPEE